jgi:ArsR family transcriptional regulator
MDTINFREKAELLRVLGHPVRLRILQELLKGTKCVSDIQDLLSVPQSNISQHLLLLRRYQVIDYTEDGALRCYFITRPELVRELFRFLKKDYAPAKGGETGLYMRKRVASKKF